MPLPRLVLLTLLTLVAFAANSLLCRAALGVEGTDAVSFTLVRLATGAGAVAGAAAGNAITNSATTVQSFEWTIRLESGQTISVIQASPTFSVGQRVQVIQSGSNTRLAAA